MATVLHYIHNWLPVSEQFVAGPIVRGTHRSVILSKTIPSRDTAFPHSDISSLASTLRFARSGTAQRLGASAISALLAFRRDVDVFHIHFGYNVRDLLPLLKVSGRRSVLSLHGHDVTALPRERPGHYDGVFDVVDVVIVPSKFLAEQAAKLGASKRQIRILPSGVDTEFFKSAPLDTSSRRVVFVGRFVQKKGIDDLVAAWREVSAAVPGAHLHLLGYGPLASLIPRTSSITVETPDAVSAREQVRRVIKEARVVVTPSKTAPDGDAESLLVVNLEAQASGRPLVTTRHGGIPEFVAENRTALVVGEGDRNELAAAMIKLLQDDQLARRMAEAGPRWVAQFDLAVQTLRLDRLYEELAEWRKDLGRKRRRAFGAGVKDPRSVEDLRA